MMNGLLFGGDIKQAVLKTWSFAAAGKLQILDWEQGGWQQINGTL